MLKTIKGKLKSKKGITLIEVIIVLVIMAVMAAAIAPTMLGFLDDAKGKTMLSEARVVYLAAQASIATQAASGITVKNGTYSSTTGAYIGDPFNKMVAELGTAGTGTGTDYDYTITVASGVASNITYTKAGKKITLNPGGEAKVEDVTTGA